MKAQPNTSKTTMLIANMPTIKPNRGVPYTFETSSFAMDHEMHIAYETPMQQAYGLN